MTLGRQTLAESGKARESSDDNLVTTGWLQNPASRMVEQLNTGATSERPAPRIGSHLRSLQSQGKQSILSSTAMHRH